MTWYNVSSLAGQTSLVGLAQGANNIVGGWLGTLFLLGMYAVWFGAAMYKTNDTAKSFLYAGAVTMVTGIMLAALGLVGEVTVFIIVIGCALSMAAAWKSV